MKKDSAPGLRPGSILLVALSLSIGWGVRGNWGHEYGAMIPGALAAMAACLLSGREDWRRRIAYFAFFGALGWSFGGSISFMQVVGYTHSGHFHSQLYGFACLFVIGFLWAAFGGAGSAFPAFFTRERLAAFFPPLLAIFLAWILKDFILGYLFTHYDREKLEAFFDWYNTDWVAALTAPIGLLALWAIRRRWCEGSSLMMFMALGWWAGFLVLVNLLHLRMTPPRGDSWAGSVGMFAGMMVYFYRRGWGPLVASTLIAGFFGGFAFSFGQLLKLLEISSGLQTNWHSVLEQSWGFLNGIGIAVAFGYLSMRTPPLEEADQSAEPRRSWTEPFSVGFLLIVITYLNISKNVGAAWIPGKAVAKELYGVPTVVWFNLAYLALAVLVTILIARHRRSPLAILPADWLGRGQLLYLLFLWWIVIGNLLRTFPFADQRLITEGVIHLNACICTLLVLLLPGRQSPSLQPDRNWRSFNRGVVIGGLIAWIVLVGVETGITRAVFGDHQIGGASLHIRFGPNATIHGKK